MTYTQQICTNTINLDHGINKNKTLEYGLHCHNRYEIYYFISGDVSYLVEGKKYNPTPHSILMFSPGVFHGVKIDSDKTYERYTVHFDPNLISVENRTLLLSPFHPKTGAIDLYYENVNTFQIQNFYEQILECESMTEDIKELAIKARLESLLTQILYMSRKTKGSSEEYTNQTIKKLLSYLNENLAATLNLDSISEEFFISKHHLNRLFKQSTGTTIMDYVSHKRITVAQQYMLRGQSATLAAEQVGFKDYSTFYRTFKKILGYAPNQKTSCIETYDYK